MIKKGYILLFSVLIYMLLVPASVMAADISIDNTFKAALFKKYVCDNYDKNHDGYLSENEIEDVSYFSTSDMIGDDDRYLSYKGLELFKNLTVLKIYYGSNFRISDFPKLQEFYGDNSFNDDDLDASGTLDISKNSQLRVLNLYCCRDVKSIKVGPDNSLEELDCMETPLRRLDLSACANLKRLRCTESELTEIDISKCPYLLLAYENGLKNGDYSYSVDGENASYYIDIDPSVRIITHSHALITVTGKTATCTSAGLTNGTKCSYCGEIVKKQESIKALGHKWSVWKTTKKATTTETGTQTRTCSRCDKKEIKTIAKLPKKAQTLTVTAKKPSLKASKLKKTKQTIAKAKAFNIKGAKKVP